MADLYTDVRYIKGIGEKKALAFNKLGVFTLYDLVSYFPRKYDDRTQYRPIAQVMDGDLSPENLMREILSRPRYAAITA